jgi:hypothetical protein
MKDATHRFAVGERVVFSSKQLVRVAPGEYEVRALLPLDRGRLQYRLKSDLERYERVVSEDELSPPVVVQN